MKSFILLLVLLLAFICPVNSYASHGVETNHVPGLIEKLQERIVLFTKSNKEAKVDYNIYLLDKRLAEIEYVVSVNNIDSVEPTASRYTTYIGNLTGYVLENKLTTKNELLIEKYGQHKKALEVVQKRFKFESGWWLALQHDINATDIFATKLQKVKE